MWNRILRTLDGKRQKQLRLRRRLRSTLTIESLEARRLLAYTVFTNPLQPLNVSGDPQEAVSPLDALLVINELNSRRYTNPSDARLPVYNTLPAERLPYLDVSCDGAVTPFDALLVINTLNTRVVPVSLTFDANGGDGVSQLTSVDCRPQLNEGTAFVSSLQTSFIVPPAIRSLRIAFADLNFDTTTENSIRDSFEIALLDDQGGTVVLPFEAKRDAIYNASEGQPALLGASAQLVSGTIDIDLQHIPAATKANLIIRLINNDADTKTSVRITKFELREEALTTPTAATLATSSARASGDPIDFSHLEDVSPSITPIYGRTALYQRDGLLHTELSLKNTGTYAIDGPVIAVIDQLSNPQVQVRDADGVTADGQPYLVMLDRAAASTLPAGSSTATRRLTFHNPDSSPFTYKLTVLAAVNRAPAFTGEPLTQVKAGGQYTYAVTATDLDGDTLSYRLLYGPKNMTLAGNLLTWNPISEDVGNHTLGLQVSDGRGGRADLAYQVQVTTGVPNRPPVITSTPLVDVNVGTAYQYHISASDADGDGLVFRLVEGAPEMQLDANTGRLTWSPNAAAAAGSGQATQTAFGTQPVTVSVEDGQGGSAQQSFTVAVHPTRGNHQPVIVSTAPSGVSSTGPLNLQPGFMSQVIASLNPQYTISGLALGPEGTLVHGSLQGPIDQRNLATGQVVTLKSTGLSSSARMVVANGGGFGTDLLHVDFNAEPGLNCCRGTIYRTNRTTGESTVLYVGALNRTAGDAFGVALGNGGAFGSDLYVMDFQGISDGTPLLERITPSGEISVFAEGGPWTQQAAPTHIEFSPGGQFGEFLYVADSESQKIWKVSPSGAISEFTLSEPLQPRVIRFAKGGAFGDFLYAAEATGRVVRIAADGSVTPFIQVDAGATEHSPFTGDMVFDSSRERLYIGLDNRILEILPSDLTGFHYDVRALDADSDPLSYEVISGSPGIQIDRQTGHLQWYPSDSQSGQHPVIVRVEDGNGGFDSQSFTINVQSLGRAEIRGQVRAGADVAGATGRAGIDVFLDQNQNGLLDDGELSAISDDQGNYAFHGLQPGIYVVAQALEPGLKRVQPASGSYEVIAAGGQTVAGRDFVNIASTVAEIRGVKFHDLNADGLRTYSAVKVVVPGTANPWLAGLHDGATAALGDMVPQQSPVQARIQPLMAGLALMFDVSGSVSFVSGPQGTDPDGEISYIVAHSAGNENGFSNSVMPVNALVGVFLSDEAPTASSPPASLSFTEGGNVPGGVNYTSLSPRLKQPFFIGDGRTSSGQLQQVIVPAGATRLYLGTQDGIGWYNNWGSFDVTVYTAKSEPGLKNWTIYLDENGNDLLDAGERSTFTDKEGQYAFTDLAPGGYKVSETLVRYYDAVADFSFNDNPNSPWSYGYSTTRGTEFQLSTVKAENPSIEIWSGTSNGPHVIHNRTGETIFGGITYPPDVLSLDPSYDGRNAVLRFTAPETDTYRIRGRFQGIDRTRGPSTDVAVLKNSQAILEGTINGFFTDLASTPGAILNFDTVITAQAGDVIDFSVGHGPDDSLYDSTGVAAIITGSKTFEEGLWRQTAPAAGSHAITLSAGEVRDDLDFGNLKITQPPPESHGPRFISAPVTEIRTGQIYRYESQATDTDGDSLTFSLAVAPAGMVIDRPTGLILWNPTRDQVGEHDVILQVRDAGGAIDIQAFRLTVTSGGGAPSITSDPPGPAGANLPYLYKLRAQDPDGDILTYRLASPAIGNLSVDPEKGWLSWRPTSGDVGQHSIQITATDTAGLVANQTFVLAVVDAASNRNPTIESEPRLQAKLANGYLYAIDAFDPDGDPLVYEIVTAPSGLDVDADGVVTWTPQPDQIGANPVQVRVSDARGGQQTQAFTVTVDAQSVNRAPSITSAPLLNAALNVEYQYQVKAVDADGDTLAFALEKAPLGLSIDPLQGTLRWNPQVDQIGEQVVEVRVSDPAGASATQRFSVTVRSSQLAPQITSSPITTATVGRNYRYAVRANDPEGRGLRYTLVGPSGDMSIDGSGLVRWQPTAAELGQVNVVVRVTDEQGASTDQAFPVTVSSTTTNRPPLITSTPILGATLQALYQLQVTAEDPDGDALRFGFLEVPAGMTIDENSGLIRWTPDQAGIGRVTVLVQDAGGGDAEQSFEVVVGSNNTTPVITSRPNASVAAGATYRYDVQARDADADLLQIELQSGPAGMRIDNFGRISWSPSTADAGTHRVRVMASDGRGGSATQEFDLTVLVDSRAPLVYLYYESPVPFDSESTLVVRATDNTSVKSLSLTVDGVALPLDSKGRATVRLSRLGQIPVVATATDGAGNVGTQSANVLVIDTTITEAPSLSLDSPDEDASVTTLADVIGSVSDPNLISWQLELVPLNEGQPRILRQSNQPVAAAGLGQIDASLLQNGAYMLRLTAINAGGLQSVAERPIFIDGERKLGNFSLSFTDLSIPVAGIPIAVVRNYSTLNASVDGELGYGWSLSYRDVDLRTSLSKTGDESGGLFTPFRDGTRVYVTLPGGQREGFTFRPKAVGLFDPYQRERDVGPEAQSGSGLRQLYFVPYFVPDKGVTSKLTVLRQKLFKQGHEYFQFGGGLPYNPADSTYGGSYTLSTKAGRTYRIDAELGSLTSVTDAAGNSLQFTDDRIESSMGAKVSFARDLSGRITAINDPMGGSIRYAYDASGNLESTTDRSGNKTTYFYLQSPQHFLERYVDPLGNTGVKSNYDSSGRLTSVEDASGKPVSLTFDVTQGTEISQDPLGNRLTRQYDERGNIITIVDALGKVTRQSYDDNNNLLSVTSPLGFTATFTYDSSGNVLSETDPRGQTLYTYDAAGRVLTTTRPDGATFTTAYNTIGRPVATTDPLGNVLRATYDTAGRLLTQTDSSGATSSFAYDNLGRLANATDALGRVRSFTYDANGNRLSESQVVTTASGPVTVKTETTYDAQGRPTKVTGPDGTAKRFEYDALGRPTAEINQLGQRTVRSYNASGRLVSSVLPDGRITKTDYDAVGRVQNSLDEDGQTTKYVYDPIGNIIETLFPDDTPADDSDNPRIRYEYDAVGQLIAQTDALGNRTEFAYDAAGNQIRVRDALGNVTTSKFNPLGVKTSETDALGRTTSYVLDELGRTTQTVFADGTQLKTVYRQSNGQHVVGPGSVSATIDEEGQTTRFSYDAVGHLIAVEDAMGGKMHYAYNELGQMISQRNALGQETRYETNLRGLRTATVLPLGQRATQTYDAASQLVTSTNFNGQSINYAYDTDGQLVRKTLPDSSSVTFSYNAQHLLESVTDARGRTLTSYDSVGQIVSVSQPDGQVISYEYDRAGRRTAVITAAGKTSTTYDALDRLSTVTAPDGGVTRYAYDAVGNLVRTELPNGTVETRKYDARDRVLSIELSGVAGLLSGFRYSYSKSGQRLTAVDLVNNQTVAYSYDALGRLVRETTSDSTGERRRITYTYDAAGNRLERNDSIDGLTQYQYDGNGRLTQSTHNGEVTQYTYDSNGNELTRVTGSNRTVTSHWDAENRLIASEVTVDGRTQRFTYSYDASGNRVSRSVDGVITRFLVDTQSQLPQVLMETTPSGQVIAAYVRGHGLISEQRGATTSFYAVDGLGSTVAIVGADGLVARRMAYDSFGRLLTTAEGLGSYFGYAGEQTDLPLGWSYLRARYYDADLGRFVSRDSFDGFEGDPLSREKYLYGEADPVNNVDPTGHVTLPVVVGSAGLVATLGVIYLGVKLKQASAGVLVAEEHESTVGAVSQQAAAWVRNMNSAGRDVVEYFFGAVTTSQRAQIRKNWTTIGNAISETALGTVTIKNVNFREFESQLKENTPADTLPRILGIIPAVVRFYPLFWDLAQMTEGRTQADVLVHELTHALADTTDSKTFLFSATYGVRAARRLAPAKAIQNADNYSLEALYHNAPDEYKKRTGDKGPGGS